MRNSKKLGSVKLPTKQPLLNSNKYNTRLGSIKLSRYKLPKRINFPINPSQKIKNNNQLNLPSVILKKNKLLDIPFYPVKTEENQNIYKYNNRNIPLKVPNLKPIKKKEDNKKEEAKIVPLIFPKINNNIAQFKFRINDNMK